jgi:hypothetical protein
MKRITQRFVALSATLMIALATVAMSAPKSESAKKRLSVEGTVLHINREARTLLVSDLWSKKLYLVSVPKGVSFRITFGLNMKTPEPQFRDVHTNDRVRMRCVRTDSEHLARIEDGREVVVLTAAQ